MKIYFSRVRGNVCDGHFDVDVGKREVVVSAGDAAVRGGVVRGIVVSKDVDVVVSEDVGVVGVIVGVGVLCVVDVSVGVSFVDVSVCLDQRCVRDRGP
jgi:hypothetical protein